MKNYIRLYHNPLLAVGAGAAGLQTLLGGIQAITGNAKMNKYMSQLEAYSTPQEIYDIVNATTARAGTGLSADTLAYLTDQVDRGFSSSVSAATQLGADPNDFNSLLRNKIDASFRIGAENQEANLRNFDKYLDATRLLADNKAAEFQSEQNLVYDKLQAAQFNKESGLQNIAGGVNTLLSTLSAGEITKLFKTFSKNPNILTAVPGTKSSVADPLPPVSGVSGPISVATPSTPGTPGFIPPVSGITGGVSQQGVSSGFNPADFFTREQILELLKRIKPPVR